MLSLTPEYYSEQSEIKVISSMLYNWDCLIHGLTNFETKHFYTTGTREAFEGIVQLGKLNAEINIINLDEYLKTKEQVLYYPIKSDEQFMFKLSEMRSHYIILDNKYILRQARNAVISTFEKFNAFNSNNLLSALSGELAQIVNKKGSSIITEKTAGEKMLNEINENRPVNVVKSGIEAIDTIIGGFYPGDIITIAGRPGMGKTIVASQIALNCRIFHKVAFLSLEMPNYQIINRMAANQLGISFERIKNKKVSAEEVQPFISRLTNRIIFTEKQDVKINQAIPMLRMMVLSENIELIIIDHLEKLYDYDSGQKKHERIGYIMDRLKSLAVELNIPIIILQQLNREVTDRKDNKPSLTDLKSSGSIEEWSDTVILLHRAGYYNRELNDRKLEMIVAKSRGSDTGTGEAMFYPEYMRIDDIQKHQEALVEY